MTETTRPLPPYQPPLIGFESHDPWYPQTPPPTDPPKPRRGVALLVAVALASGLVGGGTAAVVISQLDDPSATVASSLDAPTNRSASSSAPDGSVEQVAAEVLPSVVSIAVQTSQGGGEGTGVVLSSDGLILTNNHVVESATSGGTVTVTFNDGETASATIVGTDPTTDLAVIRAEGVQGLTPAQLGDSSALAPGEQVVAIGSPLGLQGTVTSGIVSALDRPVRTGSAEPTGEPTATVIDAIQTDAAINPGNSGGALVNMSGEVVGINSAIATLGGSGGQSGSIGLGFAIPIDQAKRIAEQLSENGHAVHAQLGVGVTDAASTGDTSTSGAVLAEIKPGGAAAKAGLEQGDTVTKVESRGVDSADALIAAIRSHAPGDTVTLTIIRDGSEQTVKVTLGSDASTS